MIASAIKWIASTIGSGLTIVIGLLVKDGYDNWKKARAQKADQDKLARCLAKGRERWVASDGSKSEHDFLLAEIQNLIPHKHWDDMLDFDRDGLVKRALKFIK